MANKTDKYSNWCHCRRPDYANKQLYAINSKFSTESNDCKIKDNIKSHICQNLRKNYDLPGHSF